MVMTIGQLGKHYGSPGVEDPPVDPQGHNSGAPPPSAERFRVFTERELPAVEAALRQAGLLVAGVGGRAA